MKSLLNITVFASAVLSIFSTSLTLYEVPELKEVLSLMEEERSDHESEFGKDIKRVYISHDVSNSNKTKSAPIVVTKSSRKESDSAEDSINIFGVKVSKDNTHRNI